MGIALTILILGFIITVHEFGHFITAKRVGITVHEFSIGMGPKVVQKKYGETLYTLRVLPIGGYVQMEGEDSESNKEGSFSSKGKIDRACVILAGASMNFVTAFMVLIITFTILGSSTNQISKTIEGSNAEKAGILSGDIIREIDGVEISTWDEVLKGVDSSDGNIDMVILRNKNEIKLEVDVEVTEESKTIGIVSKNKPNIVYGFKTGTTIFVETITEMTVFVTKLFTSGDGIEHVTGPIGMVGVVGEASQIGISVIFYIFAVLNINVGLLNLLPIPALDGGRFILILIEKITGKHLSSKVEGYINGFGMILLLGFMAFINGRDIINLFK